MRLYHGTSYENFISIMKNGFCKTDFVWNCSEDEKMYFFNTEKFQQEFEDDDFSDDDVKDRIIEEAFSSAKITASVLKSLAQKVIVLELEVPDKYIEDDDSCESMPTASQVDINDIGIENITNVYYQDFSPHMSLIYLVGMKNNHYINLDLTDIEQKMLDALEENDIYLEEYDNDFSVLYNWESYRSKIELEV